MASALQVLMLKIFLTFLAIADKITSFFGIKIYPVTHQKVFNGLAEDEIKEAKDSQITTPFGLYMLGCQSDQHLNAATRFNQILYLKNVLRKRTGIKKTLRQNPEILKYPIKRPLHIIGFPRTGTTLLYNLLAQDEQFRSPMLWEIINPYPLLDPSENWQQSERFTKARDMLDLRKASGEADFDEAHEFRADKPEECLFILGRVFLQYAQLVRLDSFTGLREWYYNLQRPELARMYEFYKQELQLIGNKSLEHKTYLLKAHCHLLCLDALLDVMPDACLVFTYRPLTQIIPSFCSTIAKGTYGYGPLDAQFGKRVVKLLSTYANRGIETMKRFENVPKEKQPFLNVEYQNLVKSPIETVKTIYDQYGFTFTKKTEQAMLDYLAKNKQHRHGKHKYTMMEFGLSEQDITENFGPYLEYFKDKANGPLL